ncbi:GHKL domain [Desulfitobacterium hafniense]|uniref:GHKL domain n=1 Tax=Desulfitobacterium hafniense TaxID=49338 RepID=A0A098B7X7_DESHA|nr:GHKL domain-containing protein [Desulfitobacterium hafniense]CDX04973.1 GHKL domain [Desulfitobacterium hafniense]
MTFTIWKIVTNCLTYPLICVWFFNQVLEPKSKQKWAWLLQLVLLDIAIAVSYFCFDPLPLKISINIIGNLLILHFFFRNHFSHKFFAEIICKLCYVGAELSASIWILLALPAPIFQTVSSGTYDLQVYLIFNPVMLLLCFLSTLIIKRTTYGFKWPDFLQFSVFSLSQVLLILFIHYLTVTFESTEKLPLYATILAISIVICVVSNIFLVRFMKGISEKAQLETENKYLQQLQDMQYEHYKALKKQQNYILGLRHDILNHIQTVDILLQSGEHLQAGKSNQNLKNELLQNTPVNFCENPIVDAVLHNKIEYANSLEIRTNINVSLAEDAGINEVDLMRVFSNLLDNAIKGCQTVQDHADKFIVLGAKCQAGFLITKLENSKSSEERKIENIKRDYTRQGQGLRIVEEIAKKHEGTFQYEDKGTTFVVTISLAIP